MKSQLLSTYFLSELYTKTQKKSVLAEEISDILDMDKISVYRRLRGDVKFTVEELGVLAKKYRISLDRMINKPKVKDYNSYSLNIPLVTNVKEGINQELFERYLEVLSEFVKRPYTEVGGAVNTIPKMFYINYKQIARFELFKWGHYYGQEKCYQHFDSVIIPDNIMRIFYLIGEKFKQVKYSYLIWDKKILPNLVSDIQYYKSMQLISSEDVELLKKDLFRFLENLETLTTTGKFKETGNIFDLYTSNMNIETLHVYMWSEDIWLSFFSTLISRRMFVCDQEMCEFLRPIVKAIKGGATLISHSSEKERRLFFLQQYEAVEAL